MAKLISHFSILNSLARCVSRIEIHSNQVVSTAVWRALLDFLFSF